MRRETYLYILSDSSNAVLVMGITLDLKNFLLEARNPKATASPSKGNKRQKKPGTMKLVYYETFPCMDAAVEREKALRAMPRQERLRLIKESNPEWQDRFAEL